MAIVTLLTDSGESDHYVAAVKARIIRINPAIRIEDISHNIRALDIAHGAYVLRSVFREFPTGTVHLVGVNATGGRDDQFIALQLEDHFFVGCDNGIFSLISDQQVQQVVKLSLSANTSSTFPERDVFAAAAARIAGGMPLIELGTPVDNIKKLIDRQVKATRKQIVGTVIRVDGMGNLITNIQRDTFELLSKGKNYTVQFGGEKFRRIHTSYQQAEQGECFLVFNSLNLLEIGIFKGNACELLGLAYDSAVNITFDE
ncbi:SAM-dependent chlorinase/fluorinase [Chryseolinea sp. T2]|uniref:SAM hydrolase/SAM-dependent halogenase family protein n=1 Tax=Chryseolinea sp. T2 TaxID=3129255 RepID=UPI0030777726